MQFITVVTPCIFGQWKAHPKDYVIVTSHRSEVSNAPSYNVVKMSSVGVIETYLYDNVTETSCLGAIFNCSIYDIKIKSYLGVVLTPPLHNCMVTSEEGVKC